MKNTIAFHDAGEKPIELTGLNWFPQEHAYRRIPLNPPEKISDGVEVLSWHLSGGKVRFRTDSKHIVVKARLRPSEDMVHFAHTGSDGFDLYVGEAGKEQFVNVTKNREQGTECELYHDDTAEGMHTFLLYLPLYRGIESLAIGVDAGARLAAPAPYPQADAPIVVYGTSITQGGCASRPGLSWTNLVSRRLVRNIDNFGFSGNGKGEPAMARLLASIQNPGLYMLDYETNCLPTFRETLAPFIDILRQAHPLTPIVIVTSYRFSWHMHNDVYENQRHDRRFTKNFVQARREAGDARLYYLDGYTLLEPNLDDDCTVDGSHATDFGFYRIAMAIQPHITQYLKAAANTGK